MVIRNHNQVGARKKCPVDQNTVAIKLSRFFKDLMRNLGKGLNMKCLKLVTVGSAESKVGVIGRK